MAVPVVAELILEAEIEAASANAEPDTNIGILTCCKEKDPLPVVPIEVNPPEVLSQRLSVVHEGTPKEIVEPFTDRDKPPVAEILEVAAADIWIDPLENPILNPPVTLNVSALILSAVELFCVVLPVAYRLTAALPVKVDPFKPKEILLELLKVIADILFEVVPAETLMAVIPPPPPPVCATTILPLLKPIVIFPLALNSKLFAFRTVELLNVVFPVAKNVIF